MSNIEEVVVKQSDFDRLVDRVDGLDKKVEDGFQEIRRNQLRLESSFMELRREQSHHSQLISELKTDVRELKQGQTETNNMVKQILEIVSNK